MNTHGTSTTGPTTGPAATVGAAGPEGRVEVARELLGRVLGGLAWSGPGDRAAAVAGLVTVALRGYLEVAPLVVVEGPPASGKSALAACLGAVAAPTGEGTVVAEVDVPFGQVLGGQDLTRPSGPGRAGADPDRDRRVWVATGSCVRVAPALAARTLRVHLAPRPAPAVSGGVGDLCGWVRVPANADLLAGAVHVLVGDWANGPAPLASLTDEQMRRWAGLGEWARLVGGVLDHHGLPGWRHALPPVVEGWAAA